MAPPLVFVIDVDNGDRVFHSGDTISGRVNLQTSKEKKSRGISLTLVGRAIVKWTEGDRNNRVTYQDEDPYTLTLR